MDPRGRPSAGFAATLLALLFAVTLRGLIPVGYMPDAGAGGLHLEICGPTAPGGTDGGADPDEGPAASESACVFAAAAPTTGPAGPPTLPRAPVLPSVEATAPAPRDPPTADRSEGPPPPARAPPFSIWIKNPPGRPS
jgi:hypothetical protein